MGHKGALVGYFCFFRNNNNNPMTQDLTPMDGPLFLQTLLLFSICFQVVMSISSTSFPRFWGNMMKTILLLSVKKWTSQFWCAFLQGALGFDNKLGQLNEVNEAQIFRPKMVAILVGMGVRSLLICWVVVSKIFLFSPLPREMIQLWLIFFQMGWNHQLVWYTVPPKV